MAELLLELFSEEIPARMQGRAAEDLKRLVTERLKAASLDYSRADAFVTPRRLALVIDGLPERQPDVTEEKRGPRVDAPDKAIEGFLKGNGLTLDQCERRDTGKGEFWFAVIEQSGRPAADVLPPLLSESIAALAWPKSMRWGAGTMRWVRSLQRVLCVLDGAPLSLKLEEDIPVGAITTGHRFHAPDEMTVKHFEEYKKKLRETFVIIDQKERFEIIKTGADALAKAEGLTVKDDPALLAEVAGLVEWPAPLIASIDSAFMDVPSEALTTAMRSHQKYFSLENPDGTLATRFVLVANITAPDGGAEIVAGNERVLRARLSDAKFFWDKDRKTRLEARVPALEQIVFHAKLGTLGEKVQRMQTLAAELSEFIPGCDRDHARSAALLAKADLTTEMVGEFPELQGVMGRYYALEEGEKPEIAQAIAEHYAPQGPNDSCPTAPVSVAVAMADKIDTLVGFFAIGETPTGSRDPFALRRAALGVIRLILESGLRLKLSDVFSMAWHDGLDGDRDAAVGALIDFFADRLKVHLREEGVRHDLIDAVFALEGEDDLVRLLARVAALKGFLASDDGANLLTAHKRAANILAIEEKKDRTSHDGAPIDAVFAQDEEKALNASLAAAVTASSRLVEAEDFDGAMAELARLRAPVDSFFDEVTVNSEDPEQRVNRLRLLSRIRATMGEIADFTRIEG